MGEECVNQAESWPMAGASWRDTQHPIRALCTRVDLTPLRTDGDKIKPEEPLALTDIALKQMQINPPCAAELKLSVECLDCSAAKANTFALQVTEGC